MPIESISRQLPQVTVPERRASASEFRKLYERESDKEDLATSAQQFEALILAQILKSAQTTGDMATVDGERDQSSSTMLDMAQECFAQAIAARGGLGIGRMVQESMKRESPNLPNRVR